MKNCKIRGKFVAEPNKMSQKTFSMKSGEKFSGTNFFLNAPTRIFSHHDVPTNFQPAKKKTAANRNLRFQRLVS